MGDPKHPEHTDLKTWYGSAFDPNVPESDELRLEVLKLAKRWNRKANASNDQLGSEHRLPGIMKSQNLGDLASDQKIQNIFHAFGYSIPVGKDGRRLWPTKFKRAMGQRMRSGEQKEVATDQRPVARTSSTPVGADPN